MVRHDVTRRVASSRRPSLPLLTAPWCAPDTGAGAWRRRDLQHNSLSTLPAGVFDGAAITNVYGTASCRAQNTARISNAPRALWLPRDRLLDRNVITSLPAGVFDGVANTLTLYVGTCAGDLPAAAPGHSHTCACLPTLHRALRWALCHQLHDLQQPRDASRQSVPSTSQPHAAVSLWWWWCQHTRCCRGTTVVPCRRAGRLTRVHVSVRQGPDGQSADRVTACRGV